MPKAVIFAIRDKKVQININEEKLIRQLSSAEKLGLLNRVKCINSVKIG